MKKLEAELAKLKADGKSSLVTEVEALVGAKAPVQKKEVPLSQKFLGLAAAEIEKGNLDFAHDCVGAAIEAHQSKEPVQLTAEFETRLKEIEVQANDSALMLPLPEISEEEPSFSDATQETVTAFADVLISAGYSAQAKKYVEAYNALIQTNLKKESEMKVDKKQALLALREGFKKDGNLAMVKAADDMLSELKDAGESKSAAWMGEANACGDEGAKSMMMKAGYMMKAAEDMEKDGLDAAAMKSYADKMYEEAKAMGKKEEVKEPVAANTKPVLRVEAASSKETRLRETAARAASRGDLKKAKEALAQAETLERARLIAALIQAGDTDLAMEGLKEEEENGGYPSSADGEEAVKEMEEKAAEQADDSAMPEEKAVEDAPCKEPEEPKEEDEGEVAKDLMEKVESSVKGGKLKEAVAAFTKLTELEKAVLAGIKQIKGKDKALEKEGFGAWRAVTKQRLHAEAVLAEHEKEDEVYEKAMEGMEMLEDESKAAEELDKALESMDEAQGEEVTKDVVMPAAPAPEAEKALDPAAEEPKEEEEKDESEEKEAEGMHYEVLQNLDEVKAMKVDRNSLAFTFWEDDSGKNPFYVVQAAGKPIAEIHLADQDNAAEIGAYFCDEQKYTKALAQSVENTNLYEMLKGVGARFYANAVESSAFAVKAKEAAVASVAEARTEKLAGLRKDYMEAMVTAAEALNKGLTNTPNALKSAFVKILSSYGIVNPGVAVEAAFDEAGATFFDQVLAGATEYLEMPKEAFAHAKKMVATAQNIALAQANSFSDVSIGHRLAQNSLPLASVPERQEAPIQASMREYGERARIDDLKSKMKLGRKV